MEIQSLNVNTRKGRGKEGAAKTRATGKLPAILYGGDQEPVCLDIDLRQFEVLVHRGRGGEHAIVRLDVVDAPDLSSPALLKEVQRHPLRGQATHADFMRISLDKRITTMVSIRVEGHAVGVVEGGVIDQQMRQVEVECLALDVPDEFVVDVTNLHIGEGIHLGQIQAPSNVTILTDLERPVVAIHAPRAVREEVEAAVEVVEGEAAQPEVIGEKKEKEKEKDKDKK